MGAAGTLAGAGTLAVTLVGCSAEPADTHPDQPVSKRREIFKSFTRNFEPIGQVARDRKPYQAAEFLAQAQALAHYVAEGGVLVLLVAAHLVLHVGQTAGEVEHLSLQQGAAREQPFRVRIGRGGEGRP